MKYGFKTLAAALAIGLATAFVANDANADAKYKVAYIARSQRNSFAAWLANSIIKEAQKYPDMTLTVFDGQSKNEVLQQLIENAVQNKFDLTIIQSHDPSIQLGPVKAAIDQGMRFVATNPKFDDEFDSLCRRQPVPAGRGKRQAGAHSGSEECAGRRADGTAWKPAFGGAPHSLAEGVLRQAARTSRSSTRRPPTGTRTRPCVTRRTGSRRTRKSTRSSR